MRNIDLNKPLTKEDRAFLEEWSRRDDIYQNDARFGNLSVTEKQKVADQVDQDAAVDEERNRQEEVESAFDEDLISLVDSLETGDLRARLQKAGLDSEGERDALEERLLNHLQDEREAGSNLT